jgi:GntR family transcriptional regulator/MocR family aminotransferase
MGSLSKVMYPGLRVGYLCAPPGLVEKLLSIKSSLALWTDCLAQAALARFIDEGRLDRRIRRLKRGCRLKRELIEELAKGLPIEASATGEACGMHCALAFPGGLPARFDKRSTLGSGFAASPLSSLSILPRTARGGREAKGGQGSAVLIGYGSLGEEEIRLGFSRIAAYLPR